MAILPLPDRTQLAPEAQVVHDRIASSRGSVARVFRALLLSPPLAEAVAALGHYLRFESPLGPALRERVILSVAGALGCDYERRYHEPLARAAGLTEGELAALFSGRIDELDADARALAGYVRRLVRHQPIDAAEVTALERMLGPAALTEVTVLAGYYAMLAGLIAAYDIEPEDPP